MDPCSDAARFAFARANRQFLFVRVVLHPSGGKREREDRYDDGVKSLFVFPTLLTRRFDELSNNAVRIVEISILD